MRSFYKDNLLTPHQRVLASYERRPADRLPLDFLATHEFKAKIKKLLGIKNDETLLRRLGVDVRAPKAAVKYVGPPPQDLGNGLTRDMWGFVTRKVHYSGGGGGFYTELVNAPLADAKTISDIEKYPLPMPREVHDFSCVNEELKKTNPEGRYWIRDCCGVYVETSRNMRGYEQFMIDLAERPEMAEAMMDKVLAWAMEYAELYFTAADGLLDEDYSGGDVGTLKAPLFSPAMWERYFFPRDKKLYEIAKRHGVRVFHHSCGSIYPFIGGFIRAGVDVLNFQRSAANMDPEKLKKEFGGKLVFHGGMDVQTILRAGSVDDVKKEADFIASTLGAGGGFIFGPTHNIQADAPVENVLAMYDFILGDEAKGEFEDIDNPEYEDLPTGI